MAFYTSVVLRSLVPWLGRSILTQEAAQTPAVRIHPTSFMVSALNAGMIHFCTAPQKPVVLKPSLCAFVDAQCVKTKLPIGTRSRLI